MMLFVFEGTDPNAGIIKKFKQTVVSNMTTSRSLGFRLAGMKVCVFVLFFIALFYEHVHLCFSLR
jgi:hypothetical protein